MKYKIVSLIVSGAILIVFTVRLNNNKMISTNSTELSTYHLEEKYYLSYDFVNKGILNPKIKDITLLDNNYKLIPYGNNDFSYESYIDDNKQTGTMTEKSALFKEIIKGYKNFKGYRIKGKDFQVVLAITFHRKIDREFIPYIRITYDILGMKRAFERKVTVLNSTQSNQ